MKNKTAKNFIIKFAILLFWLGVWQVAFLLVDKEILIASPMQVLSRLIELMQTLTFWQSAFYSLLRIAIGYIIGIVFGTGLAIICSRSNLINQVFAPILTLIKSTPVVSFIILALVWIDKDGVAIFISFLMVVPIVWSNLSKGIANTDPKQIEMAKVFGFSYFKRIKTVYFHSVLPFFVSAATTSLGLCWKAGISAEVLSMPIKSIGYNLYRSKINIETADLFAWTIVVIILSLMFEKVITLALGKFQKRRADEEVQND